MTDNLISSLKQDVDAPVVSVLIAAYNGEQFIEAAMESVWQQTYRPIELIVVDDGSTDGTLKKANGWAMKRKSSIFDVRVVPKSNGGLLSARNRGVEESSGEYIQFLDQDDLLHPQKLEKSVLVLQAEESEVVVSHFVNFREESELNIQLAGEPKSQPWNLDWQASKSKSYYVRPFWGYLSPIFKRTLVQSAGRFPEEYKIDAAEEMEFHARIKLLQPAVTYLEGILAFHRVRPGSITHDTNRTIKDNVNALSLVAELLQRHNINDKHEWRYLLSFSFKMFHRSIRYARSGTAAIRAVSVVCRTAVRSI